MKKIYLILSVGALLCGCDKQDVNGVVNNPEKNITPVFTLTGVLEDVDPAKTTIGVIGDNKYAVWSENDKITVFGDNDETLEMTVTEELEPKSTKANFKASSAVSENFGTPSYAIYPASGDASIVGSNISFHLPAIQNYAENSFADGSNVAVSVLTKKGDETYDANFRNVCGYLKINLKGAYTVTSIRLNGKNGEKLNGEFVVNASASNPIAEATSTRVSGDNIVTLDCGDGVQLSTEEETPFIFVVPVGSFSKGFSIAVNVKEYDNKKHSDVFTTKENTISRSHVRNMVAAITIAEEDLLPNEYTRVEYIESPFMRYNNNTNRGTVIKWTPASTTNNISAELTAECVQQELPTGNYNTCMLFDLNGSSASGGWVGGRSGTSTTNWCISSNTGQYSSASLFNKSELSITKLNSKKLRFKVGEETEIASGEDFTVSITSIYFFGSANATFCGAFRLYKAKIYNISSEKTLIGDLVPVRTSKDGAVVFGLYDKVQDKFFGKTYSTYSDLTGPMD